MAGALALGTALGLAACESDEGNESCNDEILLQCGYTCPGEGEGLLTGNSSISTDGSLNGALAEIVQLRYQLLRARGTAEASVESALSMRRLAVDASLDEVREGTEALLLSLGDSFRVVSTSPNCERSASAAREGAEACEHLRAVDQLPDGFVAPLQALPQTRESEGKVICEGTCARKVQKKSDCEAAEEISCRGVSNNGDCNGTCDGTCFPEEPSACPGTCVGTCDGTCLGSESDGKCEGFCDGTCDGTCTTSRAQECEGRCAGICRTNETECPEFSLPQCESNDGESCDGSCDGTLAFEQYSTPCALVGRLKGSLDATCEAPHYELFLKEPSELSAAEADDWNQKASAIRSESARLFEAYVELEHLRTTCHEAMRFIDEHLVPWIENEVEKETELQRTFGLSCALDELHFSAERSERLLETLCDEEELSALSERLAALLLLEEDQ